MASTVGAGTGAGMKEKHRWTAPCGPWRNLRRSSSHQRGWAGSRSAPGRAAAGYSWTKAATPAAGGATRAIAATAREYVATSPANEPPIRNPDEAWVIPAFSDPREASGLGQRLFIGTFLGVGTDRGEVFVLLRKVLLEAPGRRRRPCPLQPERRQGCVDGRFVDDIGVGIAFELQEGDYGVRFFSGEDRKATTRVVVGGHGTVPPRIDERRSAVPHLQRAVPGRDLGGPVGEAEGQMEQGIRRPKPSTQVGDQIRREEVPEARLREEAKRVCMAV